MKRNEFVIYDDSQHDEEEFVFTQEELNIPTKNLIIAIADLGLWSGRKQGYKILGENVAHIFDISEDFNKYYCDGKDIKAECSHHDGTNYITFREFKDISEQQTYNFLQKIISNKPLTQQQLYRYTSSLKKYFE